MLRPMPIEPIPPETARVARTAFPKGHRYLRLAGELDTLFTDETLLELFPTRGQPAWPPWRLAVVTMLQFGEGLSDRQAVGDRTVKRIGSGDVVLAEDLTGQGHITRVVGHQPRFSAVVPLADAQP